MNAKQKQKKYTFRPKDIIVGAQYHHPQWAGTVYMGIGVHNPHGRVVEGSKKLVIVISNNPKMRGSIVHSYKNSPEFWNGFVLIK